MTDRERNHGRRPNSGAPRRLQVYVISFFTENRDDGLITFAASEICGESKIFVGTEAKVECSGYIRSLTRGVCRRYQVPGNKY